MKKILFPAFFCAITLPAAAQVSVSYYPLSSYVGISSNPERRVWVDFRLLTNTFISNSNMELCPMVNIRKDSIVKVYVGASVNFNIFYGMYNQNRYINGYAVCIGTRVSPFRRARNFSFIAEISPYVNSELVGSTLRTSVGFAWRFGHKHRS